MKRDMERDKKIGLALLVLLGVAAAIAVVLPEPKPPVPQSQLGRMVTVRDRAIIVSKVETLDGIQVDNQFATPITGELVLLRMTVANKGNTSGAMTFSSFELRDSQGRIYDEITDLTYSLWRDTQGVKSRTEDMYPGEARPDLAVFRVSPGASGFTLLWNGEEIPLS